MISGSCDYLVSVSNSFHLVTQVYVTNIPAFNEVVHFHADSVKRKSRRVNIAMDEFVPCRTISWFILFLSPLFFKCSSGEPICVVAECDLFVQIAR